MKELNNKIEQYDNKLGRTKLNAMIKPKNLAEIFPNKLKCDVYTASYKEKPITGLVGGV